eukprot:6704060-Pyramimonas_sp.AAC.1
MDAVYWSFAESDEHLQNEDLWLTLSTARVAKAKDLPGGIGQSIRMMPSELCLIDRVVLTLGQRGLRWMYLRWVTQQHTQR